MKYEEMFSDAYVGITQGKRTNGIRITPYIELRGELYDLRKIQLELLSMSIGCTIRNRFLRIQGIQNCKLIAPYTKHQWFRDAIMMFDRGEHLTEEGKLKIMSLVPTNTKTRTKRNKLSLPGLNVSGLSTRD